jgi:hypothetical protein
MKKAVALWFGWIAWAAGLNAWGLYDYYTHVAEPPPGPTLPVVKFVAAEKVILHDQGGTPADDRLIVLVQPPSPYPLEIEYTVEGDAGGQVRNLASGKLEVAAGQGSVVLPFRVEPRAKGAGPQQAVVTLQQPRGAKLGEPSQVVLVVKPAPRGPLLASLEWDHLKGKELKAGEVYTIAVRLNRDADQDVTVDCNLTASAAARECLTLSQANIPREKRLGEIQVRVSQDKKGLTDQERVVKLHLIANGNVGFGAQPEATLRLEKSYKAPPLLPAVSFLKPKQVLREGEDRKWTVTVSLDPPANQPVKVFYTLQGSARPGKHYDPPRGYTGEEGFVTIEPKEPTATVEVPIRDHDALEPKDVDLTFRITKVVGAREPDAAGREVKVTIEDADSRGDLLVLLPSTEQLARVWDVKLGKQIDDLIAAHRGRLFGGSVYFVGPEGKDRKRYVPGQKPPGAEKQYVDAKTTLDDFFYSSVEVVNDLAKATRGRKFKTFILWASDRSPAELINRTGGKHTLEEVPADVFAYWVSPPNARAGKDAWLANTFQPMNPRKEWTINPEREHINHDAIAQMLKVAGK